MKTLDEINTELETLFQQRDRLNEQIVALRQEQQLLMSQQLLASMPDPLTPEWIAGLDWTQVTGDAYQKITRWLHDNYYKRGLKHGGYVQDTLQLALELCFDKNRLLEDQLGILDFLPHLKPTTMAKGSESACLHIKVFEYTLSARGVYSLRGIDGHWQLVVVSYSHARVLHESDNFMEMLQYVYETHPYQKRGKS